MPLDASIAEVDSKSSGVDFRAFSLEFLWRGLLKSCFFKFLKWIT